MIDVEDLTTFLQRAPLEKVSVVSFKNVPPQFVQLSNVHQESINLVNETVSVSERQEEGRLKLAEEPRSWDTEIARVENFAAGRVHEVEYLCCAGSQTISGVRMRTLAGRMTITCGDAPYSLFFAHEAETRGRPEFSLSEYESKAGIKL